jgi:colanic acid biosynthesis protein WcaH
MKLDSATFLKIVELTPLVSIDLIVFNDKDEVLLGYRKNRPARDSWFVPGGKILKDEHIHQAFRRISQTELGLELAPALANFKGVYEHLYRDNFAGAEGISTHYIVLAHEFFLPAGTRIKGDEQHAELRWWQVADLLAEPAVHENTKAYFRKS